MQRRLYIDEAHRALDIFRLRFRDSALPYTAVAVIFILRLHYIISPIGPDGLVVANKCSSETPGVCKAVFVTVKVEAVFLELWQNF